MLNIGQRIGQSDICGPVLQICAARFREISDGPPFWMTSSELNKIIGTLEETRPSFWSDGAFSIRSRRNPRSRCAWLTGPEPRCGYARTSFGIDAAAEVTISKCNLWKSWTLELTSEFSHARLTIFSTVWDTCWFYQDHASRRNAKLQKIYQYFVG